MEHIRERCEQYNDGLISAHELLGFIIEIIGEIWQEGEDGSDNQTELANRFVNSLALIRE